MPTNSIDDRDTCDNGALAAVQPLPPGVAPGASVTVRGRGWRVEAIVPHADCRELHLAGAASSDRRVLLWPFDRPVASDERPRLRCVRLRTWAAAVAAARADAVDPLTPRARFAAADILAYQLSPAVAVAEGASRVLLADEVGLGKTIQAGWIIADLFARERAGCVLVAVPAGLRRQWAQELSTFFDINTIGVDARWLRGTVADIPADVSPWAPPGVYLGSMDFLKRPDVAASLDAQIWDLLVVDEAHTATSPTERHAALAEVAARARRPLPARRGVRSATWRCAPRPRPGDPRSARRATPPRRDVSGSPSIPGRRRAAPTGSRPREYRPPFRGATSRRRRSC